jgi:hypothetical protein
MGKTFPDAPWVNAVGTGIAVAGTPGFAVVLPDEIVVHPATSSALTIIAQRIIIFIVSPRLKR